MDRVDLRQRSTVDAAHPEASHDLEEFVNQLIKQRRRIGMSQVALAARLGTSQRTVSQLENRTHEPKASTIAAWARAVGLRLVAGRSGTESRG